MKAVILAGGEGLRLRPLTEKIPKPLIKIGNKSIIEHQIELLERYGFEEIFILAGYLGDKIQKFLKTKKWKSQIKCLIEDNPLGSAGALKILEKKIKNDFLTLSGDVMLDIDLSRFIKYHRKKKGIATFICHPNNHPFDSDLVEIGSDSQIISLFKRPHPKNITFHNLSIASVYLFKPQFLKYIPKNKKTDIEKDILPKVLKSKEMVYIYKTPEYIQDIGTFERLNKVRKDFAMGKIDKLNLKNKQRAVFLDRDGVINEEVKQLSKIDDLRIYKFSSRAIQKINEAGYLVIIVTNQPMIAKGFMTEQDLDRIHKKLETELGKGGAKIDAIYYCPHYPEKGFPGERSELKIKCKCRKPEIGLFLKAKKEFNINFQESYVIGDQTGDILAGERAKCKTILVKTGYGGKDKLFDVRPDFTVDNLLEAIHIVC